MSKFKIALCQLDVVDDKDKNLKAAESMIREAALTANVIVLPEMFNCPYHAKLFKAYGEYYPGDTTLLLSSLAKELNVVIVGGSIPELDGTAIYNTCYVFNGHGELIGKHRKAHLFDVDIKGKITFKESDTISAGNQVTVVQTEFCKIGLAVCYDVRFPELIRSMTVKGAELIIVPAAFNTTTGPAHWHLLAQMRAVDNQVYFAFVSPARTKTLKYKAYGHSLLCSPWGDVIAEAEEDEAIVYGDVDLAYLEKIRAELPLLRHRKPKLYKE